MHNTAAILGTLLLSASLQPMDAINAAIGKLPVGRRPTVPIVNLDKTASPELLRQAKGLCAFVPGRSKHVIFVVSTCEYVEQAEDNPVALLALAALIAHEQTHILGTGEVEARRVERQVFLELVQAAAPTLRTDDLRNAAVHAESLRLRQK